MKILKRIGVFLVAFIVVGFFGFVIGGAIAGFQAGRAATDGAQGFALGQAAGQAFALRYGTAILLGAMVIAAGIAFRWLGLALGGMVAAAIYFASPGMVIRPAAIRPPISPVRKINVGSRLSLKIPVRVELPHGTAIIPAGTVVEVIEELQYNVRVTVPGGYSTLVAKTKLE